MITYDKKSRMLTFRKKRKLSNSLDDDFNSPEFGGINKKSNPMVKAEKQYKASFITKDDATKHIDQSLFKQWLAIESQIAKAIDNYYEAESKQASNDIGKQEILNDKKRLMLAQMRDGFLVDLEKEMNKKIEDQLGSFTEDVK